MHPTPDLELILRDIDRYVGADGWEQPPRLFALVVEGSSVTTVEQAWESTGEDLLGDLARIAWPDDVAGAAVSTLQVLEPDHDVRITVGALRDQTHATALRYRAHDFDDAVAVSAGVVPLLERAVYDTLR